MRQFLFLLGSTLWMLMVSATACQAVPEAKWPLYFNSDRKLASDSVAKPFVLDHINGDFYRLRSSEGSPPIAPATECTIQMTGAPWAINSTDVPCGFYIVATDDSGAEEPPVSLPLRIAPFPDAKLIVRGEGDDLPVATSASRFAENEPL